MIGRSKLIAWGTAIVLHIAGVASITTWQLDAAVRTQSLEIDIIIPVELPPQPEPPVENVVVEPIEPDEDVRVEPIPEKPKITPNADRSESSASIETPAAPVVTRRITRRTVPAEVPWYRETPPSAVQQTLRAFQCARLSPSQRRNCPTDDWEDEIISALVHEARDAEPIYDPIYNVYRANSLLDRVANGPPQPGAFSNVENGRHAYQTSTGDSATDGISTLLNSNPEPVFDGGRYENWNSDAGRPPN